MLKVIGLSRSKGNKALVRVTYKPSIMPVKGEVTRMVYVKTNDPNNRTHVFSESK